MSKKMITIAAPNGLLLNAKAMGVEKDVPIGPNEPKDVPEAYGLHLIADRFAYRAERTEPEKKKASGKKAADDTAAQRAAAEKAVTDAESAVVAAGDDPALKAEAEKAIEAARAVLADLIG